MSLLADTWLGCFVLIQLGILANKHFNISSGKPRIILMLDVYYYYEPFVRSDMWVKFVKRLTQLYRTTAYSRSDHVNSNWVRVSSHHLKHICECRAVNFYFSQYSEYYIDFLPQGAILRTELMRHRNMYINYIHYLRIEPCLLISKSWMTGLTDKFLLLLLNPSFWDTVTKWTWSLLF